jgi:hypothetical protein
VHRARTLDGRDVAVKVQYPGVAEAVETDLRNMNMLFPLVKRLAPGLDVKALGGELRERIGEELDYEIEAQHQRRVARVFRGHPHVVVPAVDTKLSTRRVLVSEFVEGAAFTEVKTRDEATRDRFAEVVYRFFWGLLTHEGSSPATRTRATTCCAPTGACASWTTASCARSSRSTSRTSAAWPGRSSPRTPGRSTRSCRRSATSPTRELRRRPAVRPDRDRRRVVLRPRLPAPGPRVRAAHDGGLGSPRSPYFDEMRRQTLPPQALLLRRMEGLLFSVLGELRAGADWGLLAREYIAGDPPHTPLGEEDAGFWGERTSMVN